jgi:hypothetical protein
MENSPGKKKDKSPPKADEQKVDLTPDQMLTELLDEFGDLKDVVVLAGHLGPSNRDGHVRLYPELDYRTYFEVPKTAILRRERLEPAPGGKPTRIVVDASAKLEVVQIVEQTIEASFLRGPIASAHSLGTGQARDDSKSTTCCVCTFWTYGSKPACRCDLP